MHWFDWFRSTEAFILAFRRKRVRTPFTLTSVSLLRGKVLGEDSDTHIHARTHAWNDAPKDDGRSLASFLGWTLSLYAVPGEGESFHQDEWERAGRQGIVGHKDLKKCSLFSTAVQLGLLSLSLQKHTLEFLKERRTRSRSEAGSYRRSTNSPGKIWFWTQDTCNSSSNVIKACDNCTKTS